MAAILCSFGPSGTAEPLASLLAPGIAPLMSSRKLFKDPESPIWLK